MKFRSNVFVVRPLNRLSGYVPCGSSCAKWNSSGRSSSEMCPFVADGHQPLDQIFQLANVARPPAFSQGTDIVESVMPWMRLRKRVL